MNIDKIGKKDKILDRKNSKSSKVKEKITETFQNQLDQNIQSQISNEINYMLEDIEKIGKVFLLNPNQENLQDYKICIKKVLGEINKKAFRIKDVRAKRPGKIESKILQTIDQKMAELSVLLLDSEKNRLDLVSKIDEIKGLLIDLIY